MTTLPPDLCSLKPQSESSRKVAQSLELVGARVYHRTVQNWIKKYVELMGRYLDRLTPKVGETWRTDELYLKIRGNRKYLFAMLDSQTRFWLAHMVSRRKGNDDVAPMFTEAAERAGKIPATLVSDGRRTFIMRGAGSIGLRTFCTRRRNTTGMCICPGT